MKHRTSAAFLFTLAIAAAAAAQTDSAAKPANTGVGDYSMQVTGSVVSSEANRLVVKDDNGHEMVFLITDKQVDASLFHAGDRVTASYVTLAGTGVAVTKVVAAPALVTSTVTTYTPPPTAPTATVAPVTSSTYPANDQQAVNTLPSTAGPLPLVALIGLLGAGGAATSRRFRRS